MPGSIPVCARRPSLLGVLVALSALALSVLPASAGLVAWGDRWVGQLGDGEIGRRAVAAPVPGIADAEALSSGWSHLLALRAGGRVSAWGWNMHGQVGNPAGTNHADPFHTARLYAGLPLPVKDAADPTGDATGFVQVAGGYFASLGLKPDGSVWVWGSSTGSSGEARPMRRVPDPGDPTGFVTGVEAIATGGLRFVFLKDDGTVWIWAGSDAVAPQQVLEIPPGEWLPRPLAGASGVAAGQYHQLVVKDDGSVWALGRNADGQLGDGTTVDRTIAAVRVIDPSDPTGYLTGAAAVAAGMVHSLALKHDGTVLGWGENLSGQLGDGTRVNRPAPVAVLSGADSIGAGWEHSCAVRDGGVLSWGGNRWGQLGDGTYEDRLLPVPVVDPTGPAGLLDGAEACAGGHAQGAALMLDGSVYAWGSNYLGGLGDGSAVGAAPAAPPGLPAGAEPAAGPSSSHALAFTPAGSLFAWGTNHDGQTGAGSLVADVNPVPVAAPGVGGVVAAAASRDGTLLLYEDGSAWTWADGSAYRVLGGVVAIAAGGDHFLALLRDGTIRSWGHNGHGQLGRGGAWYVPAPVAVPGSPGAVLADVAAVAAGDLHSLALLDDGRVVTWGASFWGQTGERDGSGVLPLAGIVAIAAGKHHNLALASDGRVFAWGENAYGQLGSGYVPGCGDYRARAQAVVGLAGAVAIAAGDFHSLAADAAGRLWAWGSNTEGQLGSGTLLPAGRPARVLDPAAFDGFLAPVSAVAAGTGFSLAVTTAEGARHEILATARGGGVLALLGRGRIRGATRQLFAPEGSRRVFLAVADPGHEVASILVDGSAVPSRSRHEIAGLGADTAVEAVFTPRRVVITSPAARQQLLAGSTVRLGWEGPRRAASYRVRYSPNGGRTWRTLVRRTGESSMDWTVPSPRRDRPRCLLRVVALNARGRAISARTTRFSILLP